jgi:hypothetical protein
LAGECPATLADLFAQADHPERVFAGVLWQVAPEDDPALLRRWLDTADDSGVPLFIHLGSPHMARELKPGIMEIIEDPGVFSLLWIYPGHDAPYERRVYRYLGNRAGQPTSEIHRED